MLKDCVAFIFKGSASMESHANHVTSQKSLILNYATVKSSKLANSYELGEGVPDVP
jgi:hypothetical protein